MEFSEVALNKGLNQFEDWRRAVVQTNPETDSATITELSGLFRDKITGVITPEKGVEPSKNAALVFLSAAGREMFNYQKENFLSIFNTLPTEEKGHLIALYKGLIEKDPKQKRLALLIPELETILDSEIDAQKSTQPKGKRRKTKKNATKPDSTSARKAS
jgi:hypothetical protein